MSDEITKHGHPNGEPEYEREDLGSKGAVAFMIGLAVSGFVIYFIIVGMYRFLDNYERSQMTTASPLVTSKGTISRVVTQADMDKDFKDNGAPMLETNEMGQMRGFVLDQENQLNSYGWVDQQAGRAHIPIHRAMQLLIDQNIPVCSTATCAAGKPALPNSANSPKKSTLDNKGTELATAAGSVSARITAKRSAR